MIKTKINVVCSGQSATPYNGKVEGQLLPKVIKDNGIEVGWKYFKENGEMLLSGASFYSWEEVNQLWDLVKGSIDKNVTFQELINIAFTEAFKIEMASTFVISVNDIEEA